MHWRALGGYKKAFKLEYLDTLTSVNNLRLVLLNQSKYKEAEVIHRQVLEIREKVLKLKHPDTLTSVNNFRLVLLN